MRYLFFNGLSRINIAVEKRKSKECIKQKNRLQI